VKRHKTLTTMTSNQITEITTTAPRLHPAPMARITDTRTWESHIIGSYDDCLNATELSAYEAAIDSDDGVVQMGSICVEIL